MILDCKPIAEGILDHLAKQPVPQTTLAAVLVGNDPASMSFLKQQKERTAHKLGVRFAIHEFPETATQSMVEEAIEKLGNDTTVGGIILQLPVPKKFDRAALIQKIPIEKDVDALRGSTLVLPPAAGTLMAVLERINFSPKGKTAVVVGRGLLVGEPVAQWLTQEGAEVVVVGRDSFNPAALRRADLIVGGAGAPHLITGDHIRKDAVCIDFGYGKKNGKLAGDFDPTTVAQKAAYLTPTPHGTGPVLVAKLFENFFTLTRLG